LIHVDKESLVTSVPLASPLLLWRGRSESLTITTAASPKP
jgi:hypothetical protein